MTSLSVYILVVVLFSGCLENEQKEIKSNQEIYGYTPMPKIVTPIPTPIIIPDTPKNWAVWVMVKQGGFQGSNPLIIHVGDTVTWTESSDAGYSLTVGTINSSKPREGYSPVGLDNKTAVYRNDNEYGRCCTHSMSYTFNQTGDYLVYITHFAYVYPYHNIIVIPRDEEIVYSKAEDEIYNKD